MLHSSGCAWKRTLTRALNHEAHHIELWQLTHARRGPTQVLWVGHATVLVQQDGLSYLTDPVFSQRCAPVQWAGPKRLVPAALNGKEPELPHIDFVLLSHNHFDHLDTTSVRTLHQRFGEVRSAQRRRALIIGCAAAHIARARPAAGSHACMPRTCMQASKQAGMHAAWVP